MAQPRWGWHQLADDWACRLVAGAGINPGDLVLDIGAGTGALTAPLVRAGARVVAFELHPGRAAALRARFGGQAVTVVQVDVADLRLPRRPFRVVANPPFALTTAVLRRLLTRGSRLVAADLVLPRYAAVRWAAGRGPGADRWSRQFDLAYVGLPHTALRPAPPGRTALLQIRRRGW
ncbi:MAG: methyltransferase domain-containing protein [Actinobacteria bacterium]|nr:methyltransferase domain-containing protein [Actinomycetota bacterium]